MARRRPLLRPHRKTEVHPLNFLPANDADYIRDWTRLTRGESVLVVENDAPELAGRVDDVTEDGLILWLHLEAGAGRRLFTRADGVLIWRLLGDRYQPEQTDDLRESRLDLSGTGTAR